jgi:acyl carrier protein
MQTDDDRQALPSPDPELSVAERGYVAPRNPVEAAIAEIWTEVLMLDRVGIHDDFLELGGDSLIGGRVVSRIFERLGREIRLESLFERGTVADLVDDYFADVRDNPV